MTEAPSTRGRRSTAIVRHLTNPWVIVVATVAGGLLGAFWPAAGVALQPVGEIYVALLSICIVPMILTALASGTGQMLRSPSLRHLFGRFARTYLLLLLIPATLALTLGLLIHPGDLLSPEAVANLGQLLPTAQADIEPAGLTKFLVDIVPSNIFNDLTTENFVAIVVFALLLGIGLGSVETPATDETLRILSTLFAAFSRIFEWILAPLAIGLFCLMAGVTATTDRTMFVALIGFIAVFYLTGIILMIIYIVILISTRRIRGVGAVGMLRRPLTIAFLTDSPIIALRPAMSALVERFGVKSEVANTVVPFGVIAAQHGQILNLTLLTIFLADIYDISLSIEQIITLGIGATIGGTALFGGGATLVPAVTPILSSVGVPVDLAAIVLVTTGQVVGPMNSVITTSATATLVLLGREPGSKDGEPAGEPSETGQ